MPEGAGQFEFDFSAEGTLCEACESKHPAVALSFLFGEEGVKMTIPTEYARKMAEEIFKAVLASEALAR